jgi:(S)-ureidoglycine aminohydrolase
MKKATAIVHASPALGAAFTQYTAELEPGGEVPTTTAQRFAYVLEGKIQCGGTKLGPGGYFFSPGGPTSAFKATTRARVAVIEKPYIAIPDVAPPSFLSGNEPSIKGEPLNGDPDLQVRALIPASPSYDLSVTTLSYQPGASLPMVEMHVMEHGLIMLTGGGIYRLADNWYPVQTGDFIWMAPYCPQWFGALGKVPTKYLIYKDWNR